MNYQVTWGIAVIPHGNTFQPLSHKDVTKIYLVTVNEIHCFSLSGVCVSHQCSHLGYEAVYQDFWITCRTHLQEKITLKEEAVISYSRKGQYFRKVLISVIVRKGSYAHLSNSEWLPRESHSLVTMIFRLKYVRLLFVGLDAERILRRKAGYTRRIAGSRFGCCCPHKET